MASWPKILQYPVRVLIAVLVAAVFGALHNQVSYTVSPEYFHKFKFMMFEIDADLQNRIGAALVGAMASWWMGAALGIILFMVALLKASRAIYAERCRMLLEIVIGITVIAAALGLLYGFQTATADAPGPFLTQIGVSDIVAFRRAGAMHNASYIGGAVGFLLAFGWLIWTISSNTEEGQNDAA